MSSNVTDTSQRYRERREAVADIRSSSHAEVASAVEANYLHGDFVTARAALAELLHRIELLDASLARAAVARREGTQ